MKSWLSNVNFNAAPEIILVIMKEFIYIEREGRRRRRGQGI